MKNIYFLTICVLLLNFSLKAQKRVSEISLVYDVVVTTNDPKPKLADAFDGASASIYLKGPMSRSEMVSALASFTTIHDARTGNSVLLQEVSGQKLLIRLNADNWKEKNKRNILDQKNDRMNKMKERSNEASDVKERKETINKTTIN